MTFAQVDLPKIPERWRTVGDRHSALSASPKKAVTPVHAMVNYAYQLAEFEAQIALRALGLDPQLGWAHADAPFRASGALDLVEAIRPTGDAFIAELLASRTFSRKEFVELPTGQVRLAPSLGKALAERTLPIFERAVAPAAEQVAATIGASAPSPVRVHTRLTNADRKRGRLGRGTKRTRKVPPACRSCGELLDDPEGTFCAACLPEFTQERTRRLARAAKEILSEMRASTEDPAQSEEARRKRTEKAREVSLAA